tara:strand:+ start:174 stop:392 length:219 start_codon:yes stop_codon:yes gene_type:complete
MTFKEVQDKLYQKEMAVEYQSLTSNKIHTLACTVERKFQTMGDKIVVMGIDDSTYHDIEIDTIISINPLEKL